MDIKNLLLSSLSQKKPLQITKYLSVGRKRFSIAFEMNGKYLTIKKIKRVHKNETLLFGFRKRRKWSRKAIAIPTRNPMFNGTFPSSLSFCELDYHIPQQVAFPPSVQKSYLNKMTNTTPLIYVDFATITDRIEKKDNCMLTEQKMLQNQKTQTPYYNFDCKSTETTQLVVVNRDQQTESKLLCTESTQSVQDLVSRGTETEKFGITCGNQTEWLHCSKTTQKASESNNICTQTESIDEIEHMRNEKEAMVFLLNEIGEMIINQNYLLHNNSTLLGQISELVLLNEVVIKHRTSANSSKKTTQKHSEYKRFVCTHRYRKYSKICICKKQKIMKKRNEINQTDPQEFSNKSTQTDIEKIKLRKSNNFFSYFKTDRR